MLLVWEVLLLYVCDDLFASEELFEAVLLEALWLTAGLRYAGGALLVTLEPAAGLTELPFEVLLDAVAFTFVAVVLFVTVLLTEVLLVPLLLVDVADTVEGLRLILLLTPAPLLSEDPLLAASLSEPV